MNRSFKEFFLLLAIVAVASAAWVRMEPESEPRIAFEPGDLTVHGVKLGWTLEQVSELHGKAYPDGECYSWIAPESKTLTVHFDAQDRADFVSGYSVEAKGQVLLEELDRESVWEACLGAVRPEEDRWEGCGFSKPQIYSTYRYPNLNLTLTAHSRGYFFPDTPKAQQFALSAAKAHNFGWRLTPSTIDGAEAG